VMYGGIDGSAIVLGMDYVQTEPVDRCMLCAGSEGVPRVRES
jgi:hypothetical protein